MTEDQEGNVEMIEVSVSGLALDVSTNAPVVILAPPNDSRILPIWIGHYEAWAIAMELSEIPSKRPMTHDLLKSVLGELDAEVTKVSVTDMKESTFYAVITLKSNGKSVEVDARPSDSIALALKTKAPIFVNSSLFNLRSIEDSEESKQYDPDELKQRLKNINPEDFGKYSL